ncbi:hypothetical protein PTKIN_Ptkin15bG0130500 [Pterospermum kingtungense]
MAPVAWNLPPPDFNAGNEGANNGEENNHVSSQAALRNRLTALVVDAGMFCRFMEQEFLNFYGVETQAVDNGKDAVDLIAAGASFDLILIDVVLPRLRGLETIRQIRAMGVSCKILCITAFLDENETQAFVDAGADGFIEKPLTPEIVVPLLRELDGQ